MSRPEAREDEYHSRLDIGLWKRILAHARPFRRPLLGLGISGVLMAVADSTLPVVTGRVIDQATKVGPGPGLIRECVLYCAIGVSFGVLVFSFIRMAGKVATGFEHDIRRAAFARLQELSFSFYDRRAVGWLMARLTSDCDRLAAVIPWTTLDLVWGTSLILGISTQMLILNWRLALLVLGILPPLAAVSLIFQRKLIRSQRMVRRTNSLLTGGLNEAIMGVRTTKALVREEENLEEFRELTQRMYRYSVRNSLQAAVYLPIVLSLGSVGVGISLWRGGVEVGGDLTLGTLVAFMQFAALCSIPIQEMAERFTQVQSAQASAERLQSLLDTEPEIVDSPAAVAAMERHRRTGGDGRPGIAEDGREDRIDRIEFEHVRFAYRDGPTVLADFNLRVEAGETIALVGATGSGKSTIVSLVCRFYEPTGGVIRINGADYRERSLRWLQSNLGIVLQSPHLFSGSIRENIRYGRLEATDEEVEAAARMVDAHGFISRLERGYATEVGEGGGRLSTGEKQLVSLARAVLADPQVFVMDEATSSVDTETEGLIQRGIEKVLRGRISFIIAHRLSTIRSASRILVIDHGRILEEGIHEELLRRRGRYHALYTSQFARETEERILEGVEP
jgi:ATP-binding cassette subfamily B protein